jgi:multiple sugar transport system substrate-binding protein
MCDDTCEKGDLCMKKTIILVLLVLFLVSSGLFAVGNQEAETESASGELVIWHPYSGSRIAALEAVSANFSEANPGFTVKLEKIGWGADMRNKWVTGMASNTLPDIFCGTLDHALAMYEAGASVPANDAIEYLGGAEAFLEKPLETLLVNGDYIAIPHYGHSKCFYYRNDWLEELGETVPETWDDLLRIATAMTQAPDRYGFVIPLGDNLGVDYFYILMRSNDGAFFDAEGNVILNSPENLEALTFYKKLWEAASPEGSIGYTRRERDNFLYSDACGMAWEPLFTTSLIREKAPSLFPLFSVTYPPAKKQIGWMTESLVISLCKDTQFEEKRKALVAAMFAEAEYVQFLHHAPGGMLPVMKKTLESDLFWDQELILKTKDDIMIAMEGLAAGTPVGMANGINSYAGLLKGTDVITFMLQNIATGTPVETALAEADARLVQMVKDQK